MDTNFQILFVPWHIIVPCNVVLQLLGFAVVVFSGMTNGNVELVAIPVSCFEIDS